MNKITSCLIALLFSLAAHVVTAQQIEDAQLLSAFEEIRAMGPLLNPQVIQGTGEIFAEIHKTSNKAGVSAHRDLEYGPDAKHVLDVYTPDNAMGTRPAVVFIHGGGLTGGHKDNAISDLMYANVATYFARHDMVGINATYRLVPNITYPQGGEDMQAIVAWIRNNADEYGVNPEQIFFLCASAGCTHTSSLLWDQNLMFEGDPDIAGAILLSGAFHSASRDYFGEDEDVRAASAAYSLVENYAGEEVPVFLMSAEYDPAGIETGTAQMYMLLCGKWGHCPRFTQVRDHNHISINQHINSADDRFSSQMVEFIRETIGMK